MRSIAVLDPDAWDLEDCLARGFGVVALRQERQEAFLEHPPAAIVLDTAMALLSDTALAWQLHDLFDLPVVVIAENATSEKVIALLRRGADDVISEPASQRVRAARVASVLRRVPAVAAPASLPVVRWPDVVLDLVRRVVVRGETVHTLNQAEFALLLSLLRASGKTVRSSELMSHASPAGGRERPRTLRMYVHRIRRLIERDPAHPERLLNVWGTGYRLKLPEGAALALPLEVAAKVARQDSATPASARPATA